MDTTNLTNTISPVRGVMTYVMGAVKYHRESSAGEFHSHALAEPDVRLSPHTAPIMEPCRCTSCQ